MQINHKLGVEYDAIKYKAGPDGEPVEGTREVLFEGVPNLITDFGMDTFGTNPGAGNWGRACVVGSGSTPPSFSDTALANRVANSVNRLSSAQSRFTELAEPYVEESLVYRFAAGVAAGTLTEVGLGYATTDLSGGGMSPTVPIVSRALFPAAVVLLPDEILDIVARRKLYMPTSDVVNVITPTGGATPGQITLTTRASFITKGPSTNTGGWGSTSLNNATGWDFSARLSAGHGEWALYTNSGLGPITGGPTGTRLSGTNPSVTLAGAYVPGSHQLDMVLNVPLGSAGTNQNVASGISAVLWCTTSASFQVGISPPIYKTADDLLSFTFRIKWVRK